MYSPQGIKLKKLYLFLLLVNSLAYASSPLKPAITQPIPVLEIKEFSQYPQNVKDLILEATALSKQNLTYLYGSAEPIRKGMDCSGTIYYLLSKRLANVPRSSDAIFEWVKKKWKIACG